VLIGLVGIPLNTYWMTLTYWRFGNDAGTPYPVYYNCVFYLFALAGLNTILRRKRPQWAFSLGELLTIYVMLSVATAWCGVDLLMPLPEAVCNAFWFASPGNRWADILWPNIPQWLVVPDLDVIRGFFDGDTNPYRRSILLAWAGPALWWTAVATALMLAYVCLTSIFRRRWADDEKLLFPITIVPLQIAEERHRLSKSKVMWAGFALVAIFELLATLHGFFPAVPVIPFYFDLGPWIQQFPPWDAYRWKGVGVWPILIGLSYLMPLDLAFSLWFFNLFWKAQLIISKHFAWTTRLGRPGLDREPAAHRSRADADPGATRPTSLRAGRHGPQPVPARPRRKHSHQPSRTGHAVALIPLHHAPRAEPSALGAGDLQDGRRGANGAQASPVGAGPDHRCRCAQSVLGDPARALQHRRSRRR